MLNLYLFNLQFQIPYLQYLAERLLLTDKSR